MQRKIDVIREMEIDKMSFLGVYVYFFIYSGYLVNVKEVDGLS